jgi:hypothetical protein
MTRRPDDTLTESLDAMAELPYDAIIKEASTQMLGKEQPESREEWAKIMNFVAWNMDFPDCLHACFAIARSNNVPLLQEEIKEIVDFQAYNRSTRQLTVRQNRAALLGDKAIQEADEYLSKSEELTVKSGAVESACGTSSHPASLLLEQEKGGEIVADRSSPATAASSPGAAVLQVTIS